MTAPALPDGALDAALLEAALWEVRNEEPDGPPGSAGCAAAAVALLAFVLMPVVARVTPLSGSALFWLGAGLLAVAVVGGALAFHDRSPAESEGADALAEAVRRAWDAADAAALRRSTVALLDAYVETVGPTRRRTFEPGEMRARLGPAAAYVEEVERILVARGVLGRCFTA